MDTSTTTPPAGDSVMSEVLGDDSCGLPHLIGVAAGFLEAVHIGRCARVPVDSVDRYVDRLRGRAG